MPVDVQELKEELKCLPARQRAELAHFLIESLDQDQDPAAEAAWERELERRITEIKSGQAHGIPADEVFAKIREKFSARP
jgi:putative addiction module component (TIGR02574 family)